MYYPYLRGRQNELLCLRELLENDVIGKKIVPIIEPVRFNSTYISVIKKFVEKHRNLIIIMNPKVGKFKEEYDTSQANIFNEENEKRKENLKNNIEKYMECLNSPYVLRAYLVDNEIISKCMEGKINSKDVILINVGKDNVSSYEKYGEELSAKYTVIPNDQYFNGLIKGKTIVLEDGFKKARRNSEYLKENDQMFSYNHLFFDKSGYDGFSDYSIVGQSFDESGFAPLALAIHIVYFDDSKHLKVHHFVSKSNESINDPARKFQEAMEDTLDWDKSNFLVETKGLNSLKDYYFNGKFPGLGVIKKYSIMHHIELMSKFLEEK